MSSSSSVRLPRRSLLRMVEGRRVKSAGRCCPRVEIAVDVSLTGRKCLELPRRKPLGERGMGAADFWGDSEILSAMVAADSLSDSAGMNAVRCKFVFILDWSAIELSIAPLATGWDCDLQELGMNLSLPPDALRQRPPEHIYVEIENEAADERVALRSGAPRHQGTVLGPRSTQVRDGGRTCVGVGLEWGRKRPRERIAARQRARVHSKIVAVPVSLTARSKL